MKLLLAATLVVLVAAVASGCRDEGEPRSSPRTPIAALIAFARTPSDQSWKNLPLAQTVQLGLADDLVLERSAKQLRDPANWRLAPPLFRGRSATFSALELIAGGRGRLRKSEGRHRHCAAPAVPPPPSVARLRRIWVQPAAPDGCLEWWTVDAFVNADGRIEAVTLDLWEP